MTEEYSELSQTSTASTIELFSKIINSLIVKYKRMTFPLAVIEPDAFGISFAYVNYLFSFYPCFDDTTKCHRCLRRRDNS